MASGGFNAQDIPSGMEQSQTPSQRLPGRLLPQELELWSMLTDERLRSEQHKMNYQALKSEHTRLQDEFLSLQLELKQTLEEYSQQKEKSQTALSQAQDVLQQKQAQIEELKAKLASQAPEVVQRHVQEKFERNFKGRCQELEQEADHYREEFNKLRYEHTMLKTQAEYLTTEHQRTLEEINFKHEGEINKLQEEVDQLREKQTTQGEQTGLQIRALQKENSQFRLRVKALLTEMEEVQAQREKSSLEAENNSRAQARQLTEQYATICTLESEKTSLNMQKEVVQKELSSTRETCNHLSAQLDSAKEEVLKLKGQLDEVEHTAQVKHTELKMEAIKDKAEVERERDRLASEVANVKLELEILEEKVRKQNQNLTDRELELQRQHHAARHYDLEVIRKLESEKLELELKVKELEDQQNEKVYEVHSELNKVQQKLQAALDSKMASEQELMTLKTKLAAVQLDVEEVTELQKENHSLKKEVSELERRVKVEENTQKELLQQCENLKEVLSQLRSDYQTLKLQEAQEKEITERNLVKQRLNWEEEKRQYQRHIDDLEKEICETRTKTNSEIAGMKRKQKQYARLISKLRNKLEIAEAKEEQLQFEKGALKETVPSEVYVKLKKQFHDLKLRHQKFHHLLQTNFDDLSTVALSTSKVPSAKTLLIAPVSTMTGDIESQFKSNFSIGKQTFELSMLKEHLDEPDQQQKHMEELITLTPDIQSQKGNAATLSGDVDISESDPGDL